MDMITQAVVRVAGYGGTYGSLRGCGQCEGKGMEMRPLLPGEWQQILPWMKLPTVCDNCGGKGKYIPVRDRCRNCHGQKIIKQHKTHDVHIDKGESPRLVKHKKSG